MAGLSQPIPCINVSMSYKSQWYNMTVQMSSPRKKFLSMNKTMMTNNLYLLTLKYKCIETDSCLLKLGIQCLKRKMILVVYVHILNLLQQWRHPSDMSLNNCVLNSHKQWVIMSQRPNVISIHAWFPYRLFNDCDCRIIEL